MATDSEKRVQYAYQRWEPAVSAKAALYSPEPSSSAKYSVDSSLPVESQYATPYAPSIVDLAVGSGTVMEVPALQYSTIVDPASHVGSGYIGEPPRAVDWREVIAPEAKEACGCSGSPGCGCSGESPASQSKRSRTKYSAMSFIHPLAWVDGMKIKTPDPARDYRIISYDVNVGVKHIRRFEAAMKLIVPIDGRSPVPHLQRRGPSASLPGWGSAVRGLGSIARVIVNSRGQRSGIVSLRDDGSWAVALDVAGHGGIDLLHVINPHGDGHFFFNAFGRDALRDWMELGKNPFCVAGVESLDVSPGGPLVQGCPGSGASPRSSPRSSHGGSVGGPTPAGDDRPGDPTDVLCRGVATGRPKIGAVRSFTFTPRETVSPSEAFWEMMHGLYAPFVPLEAEYLLPERPLSPLAQEIQDRLQDPKTPNFEAIQALNEDAQQQGTVYDIEADPQNPFSPNNPYARQGLYPDDPNYPRNPDDPNNYYSEANKYGPKFSARELERIITELKEAQREREHEERHADPGPPEPPNPNDPGDAENAPSQALVELCEHYEKMRNNPSLREQFEAAVHEMCVDPVGQPDPEGQAGSRCAGLLVESVGDVLNLVGSSGDGTGAFSEAVTVRDRLRNDRRWRAFVGVEVRERCNSLICRGPDL